MVLNNYSYTNSLCGHVHSGLTNPLKFIQYPTMLGMFTRCEFNDEDEASIQKDSIPTGTNPPYSIVMGFKGALLSATTAVGGNSELDASMAMGRAISANLEGSGTISTANLSLVVQLACAILGSGSLTAAMVGKVEMAANLAGSGDLTAALNLIANVSADLSGTGTLTAGLRGTADLSVEITSFSELSPQNLAAAVWSSLAASFNDLGTMGEIMNNMGAVSDPWSVPLPGSYAEGTAGEILGNLSGGGGTANINHKAIADAVWNQVKYGYMNQDTFGQLLAQLFEEVKKIKQ